MRPHITIHFNSAAPPPAFDATGRRPTAPAMTDGSTGKPGGAPAPAAPPAGSARVVTLAEMGSHASKTDCWMAVDGKVYDVTPFLDDHPGGPEIMMTHAGAWRRWGAPARGAGGLRRDMRRGSAGTRGGGDDGGRVVGSRACGAAGHGAAGDRRVTAVAAARELPPPAAAVGVACGAEPADAGIVAGCRPLSRAPSPTTTLPRPPPPHPTPLATPAFPPAQARTPPPSE